MKIHLSGNYIYAYESGSQIARYNAIDKTTTFINPLAVISSGDELSAVATDASGNLFVSIVFNNWESTIVYQYMPDADIKWVPRKEIDHFFGNPLVSIKGTSNFEEIIPGEGELVTLGDWQAMHYAGFPGLNTLVSYLGTVPVNDDLSLLEYDEGTSYSKIDNWLLSIRAMPLTSMVYPADCYEIESGVGATAIYMHLYNTSHVGIQAFEGNVISSSHLYLSKNITTGSRAFANCNLTTVFMGDDYGTDGVAVLGADTFAGNDISIIGAFGTITAERSDNTMGTYSASFWAAYDTHGAGWYGYDIGTESWSWLPGSPS